MLLLQESKIQILDTNIAAKNHVANRLSRLENMEKKFNQKYL